MIDDKYKRAVREIGRFSYFEPNNLDMNAPDNAIVNNPEDYCISVSLSVWLADRNSCGDGNAKREFIYTSQNGTISFMGGSGKGDGNPGYLTTNFTEINNGLDSRGNKECLGIEYINITYESWFFPTVQIKFVDIKGAALMDPSETAASISMINNPQDITQISSGSFYRALFAYPRPLFKLAVKGFYGKEVTFDLTVKDSKIDFDSKSGNFTMVVNFIGFMYGVYTDIPMTYLMVAPYINPKYWETATDTRLKIGSTPIPRFPELMRDLMILNNEAQDKINATPEGRDFNTKSENLNNVKAFNKIFTNSNGKNHTTWIKVRNKNNGFGYTYALIQDGDKAFSERYRIARDIENTYNRLKEYGMDVNLGDDWRDRIEMGVNGYVFIPKYYVDENGELFDVKGISGSRYIDSSDDVKDDFQVTLSTLKDKTRFATSSYKTETTNELLQRLKTCDVRIEDKEITDLRNKYITFTNTKIDEQLNDYTRTLDKEVRHLEKKVTDIKNGIVEKELGFKLTIENVFKIIFAHMDAFVSAYYDMLGNIKSKIDGKERIVKKIFSEGGSIWHDIPDNVSDVSPFPYYCEDNGDGYVAVYPKTYCTDECEFVESLVQSSDKYNEAYDAAMKDLEQALEDHRRGTSLNTDTKHFIPLSFNDMRLNKGGYNPYSIVMETDDAHKFEQLMAVFLLRLAYLAEIYDAEVGGVIGNIEALNFIKVYGTASKELASDVKTANSKLKDKKYLSLQQNGFYENKNSLLENLFDKNSGRYSGVTINEEHLLPISDFSLVSIDTYGQHYPNVDENNKNYLKVVYENNINGLYGVDESSTFTIDENDSELKKFQSSLETELKNLQSNRKEYQAFNFFGNFYEKYDQTFDFIYGGDYNEGLMVGVLDEKKEFVGKSFDGLFKLINEDGVSLYFKSQGKGVKNTQTITDGIVSEGGDFKSVFKSGWFKKASEIELLAYFYIFSVPVGSHCRKIGYNGGFLKAALLQEGAYYWYNDMSDIDLGNYELPKKGEVPIFIGGNKNETKKECIKQSGEKGKYMSFKEYFDIDENLIEDKRKEKLKDYFVEWAGKWFVRLNNSLMETDDDKDKYEKNIKNRDVQKDILSLYTSVVMVYDITKPNDIKKDKSDDKPRKNFINNAVKSFFNRVSEEFKFSGSVDVDPDSLTPSYSQTNYDHQDDFKLSTYLNLKNLYDKWFASSDRGTWTYDEDPTKNPDSEFNSFFYIDTFYNDIGDKVTVNGDVLLKLIKESLSTTEMKALRDSPEYKGRSLFEFLSLIAQNCEMTLLALPQAYALKGLGEGKNDHIADVFRPLPFGRMVSGKNKNGDDKLDYAQTVKHSYVCIYSHKPSAHLDDGFMYKNDSYDINVTDEKLLPTPLQKVGKNAIPAFGVSFGKMNQSYFKDIGFDMSDQQVTEETINTTQSIAANGSDGTPINGVLYGQDLYRVFSNYAYKCNVEMMGDAQIMPLMYFQLNNIPMWRGAYMIIKVEHSIRANTMTTKFTGVRQSKNQMPFVEEGISYTNHNGDDRAGTDSGRREGRLTVGDPLSGSLKGAGSYNERDQIVKSGRILRGRELQDPITVIGTNNDPNITREKPLIILTPAHGPNNPDKKLEHKWSKKLIKNYIVPELSKLKFKDGSDYGSHIIVDETATGSGYSCKVAKQKVLEYGSDRVISVVPHWNGDYSYYFAAIVNGRGVREDALKFSQIFVDEAIKIIKQGDVDITRMPPTRESSKIMDHMGNDPAVWLNCACVLSENFFANWPSESGSVGWNNEPTAAPGTGRHWLESPEGLKTIAELHVNAIKTYIDSLSL